MSTDVWAQVVVLLMILMLGQVLYLGRAPRTKETLLDLVSSIRFHDIHEYSAG